MVSSRFRPPRCYACHKRLHVMPIGKNDKPISMPKSSFLYFCVKNRPKFSQENPTVDVAGVSKLLCAAWRALGDDERKPYVDLSKADRARYKKEKGAFAKDLKKGLIQFSVTEPSGPKQKTKVKVVATRVSPGATASADA